MARESGPSSTPQPVGASNDSVLPVDGWGYWITRLRG